MTEPLCETIRWSAFCASSREGLPDGVAEVVLDVDPAADVADRKVRPAEPGAEVAVDVPIDRLLGVIDAERSRLRPMTGAPVLRVRGGR